MFCGIVTELRLAVKMGYHPKLNQIKVCIFTTSTKFHDMQNSKHDLFDYVLINLRPKFVC